MSRRRPLPVFVALFVLPIVEIWLIFQVAALIGGGLTVLILLAQVVLGFWIIRGQGRRAFRTMNESLATGAMPDRDLIDAVTVVAGGFLLLTPGFLTDVLALFLLVPATRPVVRRVATAYLNRRIEAMATRAGAAPPFGPPPYGSGPSMNGRRSADGPDLDPGAAPGGPVIRGEVIDEDPPNHP